MKKDISIFLFSLFALSTAFARVAHHPELKKGLEGLERWADSSNVLIYFEYRETPLDGFPFATDPHCRQTDAQGVREKLEAHMDFWDRVRTPSFSSFNVAQAKSEIDALWPEDSYFYCFISFPALGSLEVEEIFFNERTHDTLYLIYGWDTLNTLDTLGILGIPARVDDFNLLNVI